MSDNATQETFDFGDALKRILKGDHVWRKAWLDYPGEPRVTAIRDLTLANHLPQHQLLYLTGDQMSVCSGKIYGWNPSQQDLFATDWVVCSRSNQ